MSEFNWQQDAEDRWEEVITYTPEPEPQRPKRRWWLVSVILLAVAVAGWLIYQQAERRVEEATTAVTDDVLSSHRLLLQAAYDNDPDLFVALLSGRDADWTDVQKAMLPADVFLDRPSLGLFAKREQAPTLSNIESQFVSLDFSPDLLSAELVTSQAYTFTLPNGTLQSTTLQQMAVYRRGSQRWLYAPPEPDFWGITADYERDAVTAVYPLRDETLVQRLAIDLEQILGQLCRTLDGIDCPAELSVRLNFSPDADALLELADPRSLWRGGSNVTLPTPTLVGLPVDEAGYQALLRGYARQMVTAVVTDLVDWQCCQGAPFHQALLDYELAQLGLATWPVTQADYQRVLTEQISLREIVPYWDADTMSEVDAEDRWLIYTVVDFLLRSASDTSPTLAQRLLNSWTSSLRWLENQVLMQPNPTISDDTLNRKWFTSATIFTQVSTEPPSLPLPDQDLLLLCADASSSLEQQALNLYRYNLARDEWQSEYQAQGFVVISPFPDDSAIVLQSFGNEPNDPIVWREGEAQNLNLDEDDVIISYGYIHPTGDLLVYHLDNESDTVVPQLVDLDGCDNGRCPATEAPGLAAWSPDGRQTIIADPFSFFITTLPLSGRTLLVNNRPSDQDPYTLFRTEGTERIPIGTGFEPFWLDNETYGYLRPSTSSNEKDIVVAKTADDIPQIIASSAALRSLLPTEESNPSSFDINYVQANPSDPNQLVVVTNKGRENIPSNNAYLFFIDLPTRQVSLRLEITNSGYHLLDFAPNGRWLATSNQTTTFAGEALNMGQILLYDLNSRETQTYLANSRTFFPGYLHDWSADGQWLVTIPDDNKIALSIPGTDYYQIIEHEHAPCMSVVWINPKEASDNQ